MNAEPPGSGAPTFRGNLGDDADLLARTAAETARLISALPPRPARDPGQQDQAAWVLATARHARTAFMARHADRIYDELTRERRDRPVLADLSYAAADRFPGLVPTRAQLAVENQYAQRDKEGLEIDQGIFFQGVLGSPRAGRHLMDTMRMSGARAGELRDQFGRDGVIDLDTVLIERRGRSAHLTVHNDTCLNAEDNQLIADMETAVDLALLDDQVHVGVLRGGVMSHPRYRGRRVFSAGINLAELRAGRISFVDFLLRRELGYLSKIVHGLRPVNGGNPVHKPWIAAVDSFAIGGGMQLLLVMDWVIAADDAYFSLPAAREGIVPGVANLRLGRLAGARLARRIILGGRKIYAAAPDAAAFCDEVVPAAHVDAVVEAAVRDLDNPAVTANRGLLSLAEEPPDRLREYLAEFAFIQAHRMYGRDVLDKVERARPTRPS
jgi:(3,5-dihydroxyphenyl)acetyl-CoA 1,2-dioxygenase